MPIANQHAPLFVPKSIRERLEAGEERDWLNGLKQWLGLMALFQMIIGNARTEMMNMMKPDVAGEPLQDFGQFVK